MIAITLARKPLLKGGTVAKNTLVHGTGALDIDASRIGTATVSTHAYPGYDNHSALKCKDTTVKGDPVYQEHRGRWPSNLILMHLEGCYCSGTQRIPGHKGYPNGPGGKSMHYSDQESRGADVRPNAWAGPADAEGLETVESWVCQLGCPVADLDRQSGLRRSAGDYPSKSTSDGNRTVFGVGLGTQGPLYSDAGGASRFFLHLQHEDAQLDILRASGECVCKVCGQDYYHHPVDGRAPYLNVRCDGRRLKL